MPVSISADMLWKLSASGKVFVASDADQDDAVTGQTSFVATTPTFLLDVPLGIVAIPLFFNLSQAGTVAGGDIQVIVEIASGKRYASGGTNKTAARADGAPGAFSANTKALNGPLCRLFSNPTGAAGYGVTPFRVRLAPDISPAEGAVQGPFWTPEVPYFLNGPSSLLIYTYAATTGPTWLWGMGWAELTERDLAELIA